MGVVVFFYLFLYYFLWSICLKLITCKALILLPPPLMMMTYVHYDRLIYWNKDTDYWSIVVNFLLAWSGFAVHVQQQQAQQVMLFCSSRLVWKKSRPKFNVEFFPMIIMIMMMVLWHHLDQTYILCMHLPFYVIGAKMWMRMMI